MGLDSFWAFKWQMFVFLPALKYARVRYQCIGVKPFIFVDESPCSACDVRILKEIRFRRCFFYQISKLRFTFSLQSYFAQNRGVCTFMCKARIKRRRNPATKYPRAASPVVSRPTTPGAGPNLVDQNNSGSSVSYAPCTN